MARDGDVKMELVAPSDALLPPLTPAESERLHFDCQTRYWGLRVRALAAKLLSLGRSYEVRYRVPPQTALQLPDLGFNVVSVSDAHLLQVQAVSTPRVAQQVVPTTASARIGVTRPDDVRAIEVEDFLVGMDERDLLAAPLALPHVRKRVQRVHAAQRELVLRFVRLDRLVQVDDTRTHGFVLDTLAHIEAQHADIARVYAQLLERNRAVVTRELTREKKLLVYVRILTHEVRAAVEKDAAFQFAFSFQQWYAALAVAQDEGPGASDESDESDDDATAEPSYGDVEIEISDDDDASGDGSRRPAVDVVDLTMLDTSAPSHRHRLSQSTAAMAQRRPTDPRVRAPASRPPPPVPKAQAPPVVRTIDMAWLELFAAADLKWLPNARDVLTSFISGLLEGFEQEADGRRNGIATATATRIAEQLVRVYIQKRYALSLTNAALHKDFARHVRMLRSNVKNAKNTKLREDLLSGAVSPERLCDMTVDDLAPEALRLERERRYELHAKSNTLHEPTGPTLVKTKHGYKEVNFGGLTSSQELEIVSTTTSTQPTAAAPTSQHDGDGDDAMDAAPLEHDEPPAAAVAPVPPTTASASSNAAPPKKRVSFADDVTAPAPVKAAEATSSASAAASASREQPSESESRKYKPRARSVDPQAGRAFLRTLFDPAQDLVESLRMYVETLETAPLATMSREFVLAQDVKLFRDSRPNHDFVYTARLQLAHLETQSAHPNERRANVDAAYKLMDALTYFRRHLDDLLTELWQNFALSATNNARPVRDRVFNYLVAQNVVKFVMPPVHPPERPDVEAQILLFELPLALSRSSTLPIARDDALQAMLTFLVDLMEQKARYDKAPAPAQQQQQQRHHEQHLPHARTPYGNAPLPHSNHQQQQQHGYYDNERPPPPPRDGAYAQRSYSEDTNHSMDGNNRYVVRESGETRDDERANLYRKRRYESSRETWREEPAHARRRVDDAYASAALADEKPPVAPAAPAVKADVNEPLAPVFFVDSAGERKPHADRTQRALTEEQRIKAEVDAYQGLVAQMFKNRDGLMAKLDKIDWDPQRETECIEFDDKFTVTRIAKWVDHGRVECVIQAFGRRLEARCKDTRLDVASRTATSDFKRSVDQIFAKWKALVRTYGDRKKQTPTTLMAANEARAKNQHYVELVEKRAGHLYECCIFVSEQMAIRHACLNQKMAKRSASEEFRDVLDTLLALEAKQKAAASGAPTAAAAGRSSSTSRPSRAAPAPKTHAKGLVLWSDDDDDDNDDYASDYSSGSDYGGGAPAVPKTEKTQLDATATSLKELIEREKKAPYDMASESAGTDDARFRATIRSLFTPSDALCAGIDALRGSLKYRGSAENVIVPNVRATIDMERLREGVYSVSVGVNDVVRFATSKIAKADACNAAIDGALATLSQVRTVWVQLLNFFHTKELAVNDIMESFHALRLANITSITSSIETPPPARGYGQREPPASGVHCVLRVGDHVVYRVVGDTEDEALQLADCRAAKFITNLIDDGLNPDEDDDDASGADTKMQIDESGGASEPGAARPNWSCDVRISDFVETSIVHTFRVDGTWRQDRDLPSEFPATFEATQVGKVEIAKLEADLRDWHGYVVKFFSIESAYEQWKLVRHVAAYGHKSRKLAYALRLEMSPATKYDMYLIPPGASINSEENLYWPKSVLPRSFTDRKQIYGLLKERRS